MLLSEKLMFSGRITITRSIWRLFVVAACPLLGLGLTLYWSWHQVAVNREVRTRAEVIEQNLQRLGEELLDAETGQRGYLLTLDARYLAPYLAAKEEVPKRLEVLASIMIDPAARRDLERIRPLASAKLDELAATVALVASGHPDQAVRGVTDGTGKRLMDDFRAARQETLSREQALLEQRYVQINESMSRVALILLIGGTAIIVGLFFFTRGTVAKLGKPIHDLVDGLNSIATSAGGGRVAISVSDEIGRSASRLTTWLTVCLWFSRLHL
jgi:CHASE3 domain sensor protein